MSPELIEAVKSVNKAFAGGAAVENQWTDADGDTVDLAGRLSTKRDDNALARIAQAQADATRNAANAYAAHGYDAHVHRTMLADPSDYLVDACEGASVDSALPTFEDVQEFYGAVFGELYGL